MRYCLVDGFSETNPEGFIEALIKQGHEVSNTCDDKTDIIYCASIVKADKAIDLKNSFPKAKLVQYCWDYYKWAHDGKHQGFNWGRYAQQLAQSDLIIVPSDGQKLRLKELLNLDSEVVETSIHTYEHAVSDKKFVLDPVRFYPEENKTWVIDACRELGIHVIHSEHQFTEEQFRDLVHSCTFMTCGYREASTGGLTLMEGLWNGKPSLVSNSPYMGASNYLGKFGRYFQYDDYEDLKKQVKDMWDNPPKIDVEEARQYMQEKFTHDIMAKRISKLCEHLLS